MARPTAPVSAFAVIPPTRTSGRAVDRSVLESPPPVTLDHSVPSDGILREPEVRASAIEVLGLGSLGATPRALERRLVRLVRAQGVRAVRLRVRLARGEAQALYDGAVGIGSASALRRADTILRRLDVLDGGLDRFEAERARVRAAMTPRAAATAEAILDQTRASVLGWRKQYGDTTALLALRADAQTLFDARGRFERASGAERVEARAAYGALHARVSARHPPLASASLGAPLTELWAFASDTDSKQVGQVVVDVPRPLDAALEAKMQATLDGVKSMQARLRDDPDVVWQLPEVVEATRIAEGIVAHGMVAAHARDVVREVNRDERVCRTFVSVTAVGLGIAAALPSGGASLAAAAVATSALDGYQLYLAYAEYRRGVDAADAGLASERPSPLPVILEAAATTAGAGGAATALAKSRFVRLLGRADDMGVAARAMEKRLGRERAASLFERFGDDGVEALPAELWSRLAAVDEVALDTALDALGPEQLILWTEAVGPERVAALVADVPSGWWPDLTATSIDPEVIEDVLALGPEVVAALLPSVKGEGLAALARAADGAPVSVLDDGFAVVRGVRFHPRSPGGADRLVDALSRWDALVARAPELAKFGPWSEREIGRVERLIGEVAGGRRHKRMAFKALAARSGATPSTLRRAIHAAAGHSVVLGRRAAALAARAPELRDGLESLALSAVSPATRARALDGVERALGFSEATISRRHLGAWLDDAADAGHSIERCFVDRLVELEYAVEVADAGRVAEGSTVFLGLKSGERVALKPGGPWFEVPPTTPGRVGALEDLDVVFIDADDVVQVVEVKRTDEALWKALEKTEGAYFYKFVSLRGEGAVVGQKREVTMAIRSPETGALDRRLPIDRKPTPRRLLDANRVQLEAPR
ncbi:MAG: hypothetical protein RIT81_30915 [Deltaproteobacteria bacterium]